MHATNFNSMETSAKLRTSSPIDWEVLHSTIRNLEKDEKWWICAYLVLSAYSGLRVSDIKRITYWDILSGKGYFDIQEMKTKKKRRIHLNPFLVESIERYYNKLGVANLNSIIVSNRKGKSVSTIYLNTILKKINLKYGMRVKNISTHSLRKSFGMNVWRSNCCSDKVLILLSEMFNHDKESTTRRYIGIQEEEITNVYLSL